MRANSHNTITNANLANNASQLFFQQCQICLFLAISRMSTAWHSLLSPNRFVTWFMMYTLASWHRHSFLAKSHTYINKLQYNNKQIQHIYTDIHKYIGYITTHCMNSYTQLQNQTFKKHDATNKINHNDLQNKSLLPSHPWKEHSTTCCFSSEKLLSER